MSDPEVLVEVRDLHKTYRTGFLMRPVQAVRGVSFEVRRGEIVGLIGPNGAGKTSTLKVMMGLCRPTAGTIRMGGIDSTEPRARASVGFLPENPYVYPYLSPREFVDLCARLSGVPASQRATKVETAMTRTGIAWAKDRSVRRLSKGMLQRTGLAAALVSDPQLLVLDEPMSGLDPLGRREVRDLIFDERSSGRTVLFSSHVLSDVEALCDRVVILHRGQVVVSGVVRDLVRSSATMIELTLAGVTPALRSQLVERTKILREIASDLVLEVEGNALLDELLGLALAHGASVVSAVPRKDSLEDLFVRNAVGGSGD